MFFVIHELFPFCAVANCVFMFRCCRGSVGVGFAWWECFFFVVVAPLCRAVIAVFCCCFVFQYFMVCGGECDGILRAIMIVDPCTIIFSSSSTNCFLSVQARFERRKRSLLELLETALPNAVFACLRRSPMLSGTFSSCHAMWSGVIVRGEVARHGPPIVVHISMCLEGQLMCANPSVKV